MTTIKGQTILSGDVNLDDKRFIGCKFTNCTLWYKGGQVEWDKDTTFIGCRWQFLDAALRIINVRDAAISGDLINFHWSSQPFSAL